MRLNFFIIFSIVMALQERDVEFEELDQMIEEHFGHIDQTRGFLQQNRNVEEPTALSGDECEDNEDTTAVCEEESGTSDKDHCIRNDRELDDSLYVQIESEFSKGCPCKKNCFGNLEIQEVYDNVLSLREMSRSEKEMFLMGSFNQNNPFIDKPAPSKHRKFYQYKYKNNVVCVHTFRIVNDITARALRTILDHMNENGVEPRVHGHTGRKAPNAFSFEENKNAITYIRNYAEEYGLPQPAAPRGRGEDPPIFLPSDRTKLFVFGKYSSACAETGVRPLGRSSFYDIWSKCCPHIQVSSPRSDVCATCEKYKKAIQDATTEEEKLDVTASYHQHIEDAQSERGVYKMWVQNSKEEAALHSLVLNAGPQPPLSSQLRRVHVTFDFAQNVSLPHHSRQMGPIYFSAPRKVQIFGVRIDGIAAQYNYLIDENQTIGPDGTLTHGPNSVISMLHHALAKYTFGEEEIGMHSDNCSGQNKNRFVMAYFCWRVMVGLHKKITYMLQIPGHTRCLVDAGFGLLKKRYRRSDCDAMSQLIDVVNASSESNWAVPYKDVNGNQQWQWRDWKSFLSQHFKSLRGIQGYQHFVFTAEKPGVVLVRARLQSEEKEVTLVKETTVAILSADILADAIQPAGLSAQRKRYLFRFLRPLVRPAYQDITCPQPEEAEAFEE